MLNSKVERETWIGARSSANTLNAVTVVKTAQAINNCPLSDVDRLTMALYVITAPDNSAHTQTVDVYVQRAIVTNPDPAVNSHWEDMYHFTQLTKDTVVAVAPGKPLESVDLPIEGNAGTNVVTNIGGVISQLAIAAKTGKVGDYYDQLRVVEVVAGAVAGIIPAVYSVYVTAVILDS